MKNTRDNCLKVCKLIYNVEFPKKYSFKKSTTERVDAKQTKTHILNKKITLISQVIKLFIFVDKNH